MDLLIVVSSKEGLSAEFFRMCMSFDPKHFFGIEGVTDVALARNIALTRAEEKFDACDVIVMLDDDIRCTAQDVRKLASRALECGKACSGLYVTAKGLPAATKYPDPAKPPGLFLTGLGCLAVPASLMRVMRSSSQLCHNDAVSDQCRAYTTTQAQKIGEHVLWLSEDYALTYRLGGVRLCHDVPVRHQKTQALLPSKKIVDWVQEQQQLNS